MGLRLLQLGQPTMLGKGIFRLQISERTKYCSYICNMCMIICKQAMPTLLFHTLNLLSVIIANMIPSRNTIPGMNTTWYLPGTQSLAWTMVYKSTLHSSMAAETGTVVRCFPPCTHLLTMTGSGTGMFKDWCISVKSCLPNWAVSSNSFNSTIFFGKPLRIKSSAWNTHNYIY
jgi:hypothetical protein